MAIRWRDIDEAKLKNVVKRYNDKIRKVEKRHPEIGDIQPEKEMLREARAMLKEGTRADFNKYIKDKENYLKKGAEKEYITKAGTRLTKYEKQKVTNQIRSINAKRRAIREKYKPSPKYGTMGTLERNNLLPKRNNIEKIRPENWKEFAIGIEYQASATEAQKAERYKENFLHGILVTLGEDSELYRIISLTNAMEIWRFQYTNPILQIGNLSDPALADDIEEQMISELMVEQSGINL